MRGEIVGSIGMAMGRGDGVLERDLLIHVGYAGLEVGVVVAVIGRM